MRSGLTVVVLFAVVGIMAVCTQQVQAELWAQWLLNVDSGSAIREEVHGRDSLLEGPTAPIAGTYVSSPHGTALQFNNSQYIRLQFPGSPGDDLPEGFMNDMSVAYWSQVRRKPHQYLQLAID